MKKIYPTVAILYTLLLGIVFNTVHYLRLGMSFRSPEYFWYLGIAKGIIEPYGSSIGNIITLPAKLDPTQYFLRGIYSIYPNIYSVQIFSSICFIATGILAFLIGREIWREHKHRDVLSCLFTVFLVSLHPLIYMTTSVFTHDTFQFVMVMATVLTGIHIINTRRWYLLPILVVLFFGGLCINMSMIFSIPILLFYALKNIAKKRFLIYIGGIILLTIAGAYYLTTQITFGYQVDVSPASVERLLKPFLIPFFFSIFGFVDRIKKRDIFMIGIFLYFFINTLFMVRNIRWLTIPIALLLTVTLEGNIKTIKAKTVFAKLKRHKTVFIVLFLVLFQTSSLFYLTDTEDECIQYGIYEKEISATQEFYNFMTIYEANRLVFVETDRRPLNEIYNDINATFIYNPEIWSMTEKEVYKYCYDNEIDIILFYPKDFSIETKKIVTTGETFPQLYSSVSGMTLEQWSNIRDSIEKKGTEKGFSLYAGENTSFLAKAYLGGFSYFDIGFSRQIRTDKRVYYLRAISPISPIQLYFRGIDITFLTED